jgi:hypothetical protein
MPERAEKGRFFAIHTNTRRRKVPYRGGMGPSFIVKRER